ncbi:MAG TPA: dephospho-CoA kinase [Candidatus Omnitrophota bacterium]|nr:dephospho-CoA kinase [Candidatus Omnitrophota bacterium]HPT06742.1 dephospho-CoA kinase [Candidatus Omnitrophota bacterium]
MKKRLKTNKLVVGLTGSFGTGKSTVAAFLKGPRVEIIDADSTAHAVYKPGTPVFDAIVKVFGRRVVSKRHGIDREVLGSVVFKSLRSLKRLQRIVIPEVVRLIRRKTALSKARLVVIDAPLLIEAGLLASVDKLIVVKTTRAQQIKRLRKRTSLSRADIIRRITVQIPLREKIHLADFVIDNNGSLGNTKKQVEKLRRQLWRS